VSEPPVSHELEWKDDSQKATRVSNEFLKTKRSTTTATNTAAMAISL
jgi:hypothetical protein